LVVAVTFHKKRMMTLAKEYKASVHPPLPLPMHIDSQILMMIATRMATERTKAFSPNAA
jgi:hypothetical protein